AERVLLCRARARGSADVGDELDYEIDIAAEVGVNEVCLILQRLPPLSEALTVLSRVDVTLKDELYEHPIHECFHLIQIGPQVVEQFILGGVRQRRAEDPAHSDLSQPLKRLLEQVAVLRPLELEEVQVPRFAVEVVGIKSVVVAAERYAGSEVGDRELEL